MAVPQGIVSTLRPQWLRTHPQRLRNKGRNPNPARPEVLGQWELAFGAPPPPYLSVLFMQKALACEAQFKRAGGLSAPTRRAPTQIACGKAPAAIPLNAAKTGPRFFGLTSAAGTAE